MSWLARRLRRDFVEPVIRAWVTVWRGFSGVFFVELLVREVGVGCVWVDSFCFNSLIWLRSLAISFSSFKFSACETG